MRILVTLSGLHRVDRGAEVALESIADGLGRLGHDVTVFGSGPLMPARSYRYRRLPAIARERFERWPSMPPLRDPSAYEGVTFAAGVLRHFAPASFDVTITCGFPVDNLVLRRPVLRGKRPAHVFVTENGDWPAATRRWESRAFSCDGLVCTNPVYFARNRDRWFSALIPNGVDVEAFTPGPRATARLGLPAERPIVLMASALIPSKRVDAGIRAVAELDEATLVVAGDGPLRTEIDRLGSSLLGARYVRRTFARDDMVHLYRSAAVLLHTAHFESFGNVYLEAMATGLPVVAHRSATTEWILSTNDALVDTDDRDEVVVALRSALESDRGRAAGERVDAVRHRFTWAAIARQYAPFLESVLDRRR